MEPSQINPYVKAEDKIILRFCEEHGGLEYAMPMIREQIKRSGMKSFEDPTKQEMLSFIDHLCKVSEGLKGSDGAKKLRVEFLRILRSVDGEDDLL